MNPILDWGINLIAGLQASIPWLRGSMTFLSFLGNEEFFILFLPLLYWCVDARLGLRVGVILSASGSVNTFFKLIDNSRQAVYGYDQRLEVFCSAGVAMAGNEAENTVVKGVQDGFHSARPPYFFMQRYAECYVTEVREFLECVRDNKPTPTTGQDGRMAVVLGHAAWKSCRENRPVKLSEIAAV